MIWLKVGLLGLKKEYDNTLGQGIQKYMYQMYSRLNKLPEVNIEIAEYNNSFSFLGIGLAFMLGNMFKDFSQYDIIHSLDQKPLILFRKNGAKLITTAHDFQALLAPEYNDTGPKEIVWNKIIQFGMRLSLDSDYLIARSKLTKEDAINLGYDKTRITVINDGVDERFFKRRTIYVKRHKFRIGYLGAFRRRKNVGFAIEAFKRTDLPDASFEIWGKKTFLYHTLENIAKVDKRIKMMGMAPESKLVQIYDRFDVFVFPSFYEGFGIPIIEAQARGIPVIIYKHGKITEEVRKYCFEADDEDHMAQILEDLSANGYDESRRKKAMGYAREFTWQKEADETLALYKRLVKKD